MNASAVKLSLRWLLAVAAAAGLSCADATVDSHMNTVADLEYLADADGDDWQSPEQTVTRGVSPLAPSVPVPSSPARSPSSAGPLWMRNVTTVCCSRTAATSSTGCSSPAKRAAVPVIQSAASHGVNQITSNDRIVFTHASAFPEEVGLLKGDTLANIVPSEIKPRLEFRIRQVTDKRGGRNDGRVIAVRLARAC